MDLDLRATTRSKDYRAESQRRKVLAKDIQRMHRQELELRTGSRMASSDCLDQTAESRFLSMLTGVSRLPVNGMIHSASARRCRLFCLDVTKASTLERPVSS